MDFCTPTPNGMDVFLHDIRYCDACHGLQQLKTVKKLANNLEIAGKKIDHDDMVNQVLAGLDEEYTPIVMQVNSRDQVSWHELSSTLMTFESRLEYLSQVRNSFGSINLT
ncbi:Uncharacterized protein Adt_36267 [Abeliophyllum distichum]|uniref:Uncharacterized protein n=1 Tax=Abeliophyllum distichum TaxID=126358 RepID=A0ABD1QHG8_9LAMI